MKTHDNFKVSHVMLIVGGFFVAGLFFISTTDAKNVYKPLTPAAQANYDAWANQRCPQEKALAQANLADIGNGVKIEGKDLNDLYKKRDMDCKTF